MNQDEARKILGMSKADADILGSFTRRKELIADRLKGASSEALKAQYREMLSQLEKSAAVLVGMDIQASRSAQGQKRRSPESKSDVGGNASHIDIELILGQTLADRYEVREKIGQGNSGCVFRAYDTKRCEDIAIKVIYPELLANNLVREHFLAEKKLACDLYHPNIVNQFDAKSDGRYFFLTMELLKGQNLRQSLNARKKARKPFTRKEVIQFVNMMVDGLSYAGKKIAHLHIRPENIWIAEKGVIKVMDFGAAPLVQAKQISQQDRLLGVDYLAPEQLNGSADVDDRADQYALGAIIYEMFTFKVLSGRKKKARIRHRKINSKFASIISKMMKPDAGDRYDSIDQIKSALPAIDSDRSLPEINQKALGVAATLVIGVAFILYAISSGYLSKLGDLVKFSTDVEQQQFDEAIQLVKSINEHTRQLGQNQKKLRSAIRQDSKEISILEGALHKARTESKKLELEQQLDPLRIKFAHKQQLQSLTDKVIYQANSQLKSADKVRTALLLVEGKKHLKAIELLKPLQIDLRQKLEQFGNAETYLAAHRSLSQIQTTWASYNQSRNLLLPADIEQRNLSISGAQQLAEKGQLAEAIEQIDQHIREYQRDYEADQKRVAERGPQKVQQAKTQKLENQWNAYLKKQRLKITGIQKNALEQAKTTEQNQLARQDFKAAEDTSRKLQQLLSEYYAASKASVTASRQKQAEDRATKAKADYEKAVAAANRALVEEDYDQAAKDYKEALSHKPKDNETSKKLQQVVSKSSSELLKKYAPGIVFVRIPPGSFKMGHFGRGGSNDEKPQHKVTIKGFNLMKHEVTFAQYDVYLQETGGETPDDAGWGRDNRPVINVNWNQATAYAKWLSQKTRYWFRLPSEAEWEYAARANSSTSYSWGDTVSHENANYGKDFCCDGQVSGSDKWFNTSPAGSFPANQFGVSDMYGNVWEWVQDCWNTSYNGAPKDGSAWLRGNCNKRVLRGGSWSSVADYLRSANRDASAPEKSNNSLGFRLLQEQ